METTKNIIHGVSLGPGDPELITLKGLKVLQKADCIYYPGSVLKNGETKSYSLSILKSYNLNPEKLKGFYLEMSLDRVQAEMVYQETFEKICKDYKEGKKVAIVSEGDLSTYSSFSYLLTKLHNDNVAVSLIPGITSFSLGASESQMPTALLNEDIRIIPRIQSQSELEKAIDSSETIILMKIRSVMKHILQVLEKQKYQFSYCERLGTPDQFITADLTELKNRTIPYFSLLIIKKLKKK